MLVLTPVYNIWRSASPDLVLLEIFREPELQEIYSKMIESFRAQRCLCATNELRRSAMLFSIPFRTDVDAQDNGYCDDRSLPLLLGWPRLQADGRIR